MFKLRTACDAIPRATASNLTRVLTRHATQFRRPDLSREIIARARALSHICLGKLTRVPYLDKFQRAI